MLADDVRLRGWYSVLYSTDIYVKNVGENLQPCCCPWTDNWCLTANAKGSIVVAWHAMILLLHKLMDRNMTAVEKIQYTVVSANMEVVIVKSHFRARLWSPLVLFHHKDI
jgi:hypothetical protein